MPHKEHLSFRELDRLMRSVPNFTPRRHGIVCKQEYSAKDCDCRYCTHYSGRGRKPGCTLDRCEYMRERIVAESATYRETVAETMSTVHYPPFVRRVNQLIKENEETPMEYQSEKHFAAFSEAIDRLNRKDTALMAALYLLTADHRLWQATKPLVERSGINMGAVRVKNCDENAYTLFCAAKDLYLGTKHLTISDLADTDLIPPKLFALICNAMAIRRFGLGAIQYKERTAQK